MFRVYAVITAVVFVIYALMQFLCYRELPRSYSKSPTREPNREKTNEKGFLLCCIKLYDVDFLL